MSHSTDVKDLAYRLWEEAGKPQDRDMDFWLQAEAALAKPAAKPKAAAAKPKAPAKAAAAPKAAAKPAAKKAK